MRNVDLKNGPDEIEPQEAKQGIELHRMRWVLRISMILAVIAVGGVLWAFVI